MLGTASPLVAQAPPVPPPATLSPHAAAPAVALPPQPLPAGMPLPRPGDAPSVQTVGFFTAKQTVPPKVVEAPPIANDLLPKLSADPVPQASKPTATAPVVSPALNHTMPTPHPMTAPAWRWYGWGSTDPHGAPLPPPPPPPATAGDPLAGPPITTAPPPVATETSVPVSASMPSAAPEASTALPAWTPAPVAAPPATDLRMTAPPAPVPAPPMADPLNGAQRPVQRMGLAAAPQWTTARASSAR